jgi:RNA polymerase sigma factor (sigma-70 family)
MMTRRKDSKSRQFDSLSGITRIFLGHNAFLKKFIARYLSKDQDIEDILQETFLKAYSAEKEKGEIDQPKAFLFAIAKNIALNELNRKSRQMTGYIEECYDDGEHTVDNDLEREVEAQQSLGIYCEAVATLPEQCRRVYLLRKVHGLRHKEIAEYLGISLSSVEKHLRLGWLSCRNYTQARTDGRRINSQQSVRNFTKEGSSS